MSSCFLFRTEYVQTLNAKNVHETSYGGPTDIDICYVRCVYFFIEMSSNEEHQQHAEDNYELRQAMKKVKAGNLTHKKIRRTA